MDTMDNPVADEGEVVKGCALRMDLPGLQERANAFGGVDPVADVEHAASARMGLANLVGQGSGPAVGHDVNPANRSKASGQKGRNGGADVGQAVGPEGSAWKVAVAKILMFRDYARQTLAPLHDAPQH